MVNLSVSPEQLTFNWSRHDSECSTVQYHNMATYCSGSVKVIDETSASTCSELQLTETETNWGCLYSAEWNDGMEWWNGTVEWNGIVE